MRAFGRAMVLLIAACVSQESFAQRAAKNIDPAKRGWFGEFYDLNAYAKCKSQDRNPANVACDYLRLTRVEEPEYWPYPNVPRPKLPDAPNPPVYKKGMTSKQYFDALCKAEAGEFIYKVVKDVEGVYQIRPRKEASWEALMDRYVIEDPYGYTRVEATRPQTVYAYAGRRYNYFETPRLALDGIPTEATKYLRYEGVFDNKARFEVEEIVDRPKAKYGFYWRGIQRPMDRELAIAGGELFVIDLATNDILGIRRGFARTGFAKARSKIQWETAEVCPRLRTQPDGWDKWPQFNYSFVSKILVPSAKKREK